jgi:hypothetical protein
VAAVVAAVAVAELPVPHSPVVQAERVASAAPDLPDSFW